MKPQYVERIDPAVVDAAIGWAVRLHHSEPSANDWSRFEAWRSARPQHALAWERVTNLRQTFAKLPAALSLQTLSSPPLVRRREVLRMLGGTAVLGSGAWMARDLALLPRPAADHATAIGDRRRVPLDDGTELLLNTDSAVQLSYDERNRGIRLQRGEIRVSSGADSGRAEHRPLWVEDRHGQYRALGTRFFVRLSDATSRVSVEAGRVELRPINGQAAVIALPGESFEVGASGIKEAAADALDPTSWSHGALTVHDICLGAFVAELARYRPGWLRCDPAVAQRRLSGVFQTADVDSTLSFVARRLSLRLAYRSRYWLTVTDAAG